MTVMVRAYEKRDLAEMVRIWNEVVEEGAAFPQEELLTVPAGAEFFASQTYNAVVASNLRARRLYEKLGFCRLGTIPGGFRMKDGRYEDICPYYYDLRDGIGGAGKEK